MSKLMDVFLSRSTMDEDLFRQAPMATVVNYVKDLNSRLLRIEVLMIISIGGPYVQDWVT